MLNHEVTIQPFGKVDYIQVENGYIAWRRGTGDNVELLHIRTFSPGKGTGRDLVLRMLRELKSDPPYATIFGFTRTVNESSQNFYKAMGFELSQVTGVYDDGAAIVFSQRFKTLLELHHV